MKTPSSTFCILPWMHMATNASGNLRVCCNSIPGKNYITREDTNKPYNIADIDALDYWNSSVYKKIRKEMLENKRPEMCARCFTEEDAGIKSARISCNEAWGYTDNFSITAKDNIKYFDIRLGNLCNLKCRMCNPFASNQWIDEWHLVDKVLPNTEKTRLKKMNWFNNDNVWNNIAKYAENIEEIYLTGGEPTLAISQYKLFDKLIKLDVAKKIRLKYNTNLTNLPQKMLDYWTQFKKVKINASIDGFKDVNKYIRYPTHWSLVEENLSKFYNLQEQNKCVLQIHITVQMYNILYLNDLLDWLFSKNIKNIYFNILNHPEYLNIRVLPKNLKVQATKNLTKYTHIEKINGVIDYMNKEDKSYALNKFQNYTLELDRNRKENCKKILPEIGSLVYA
tara:strand:+ start:791 stop:1975 length:1185 start_codon:yes stop_codon:yes gene_type:complete